jgi:hypothetical protein
MVHDLCDINADMISFQLLREPHGMDMIFPGFKIHSCGIQNVTPREQL